MRSPLDVIEPGFEHAVFTTFSLELLFFEAKIWPLLAQNGIRNVMVVGDSDQILAALEAYEAPLAGSRYQLIPIDVPHGVFHPKLILLTGERGSRLCVSSANLTVSGQLRNTEIAVVLDSSVESHGLALSGAGAFLRRLLEGRPPHSQEGLLAAIAELEEPREVSGPRLITNMDQPMIDEFPTIPTTAVTPFVDRQLSALSELIAKAAIDLVVDSDHLAAPPALFDANCRIVPLEFGNRRLHGKAYWARDGSWALVGSPNLTSAALQSTAVSGNIEAALILSDIGVPTPPGRPVDPGDVKADVEARWELERRRKEGAEKVRVPRLFNAWEDDQGVLRVDGIEDGSQVRAFFESAWRVVGVVQSGSISMVGLSFRPHLLHVVDRRGREWRAVVHRPFLLRTQRNRRPVTATTAPVVGRLPLDQDGFRILERAISDLHSLARILRDRSFAPALTSSGRRDRAVEDSSISEWIPAIPGEEPRLPELYEFAWKDIADPDTLLALVRTALRDRSGESSQVLVEESLAAQEATTLDDVEADSVEPVEDEEAEDTEGLMREATRRIVEKYRNAFVRRLSEATEIVADASVPNGTADLVFQVALQQHERLTLEVVLSDEDDRVVPLVEEDQLLDHKLAMLRAYLNRSGSENPTCLETARFHLAQCLRHQSHWKSRELEILRDLAYHHGARILRADRPENSIERLFGMDYEYAGAWISSLADQASHEGVLELMEKHLLGLDFSTDPFLVVVGSSAFTNVTSAHDAGGSPAWIGVGYGATYARLAGQPIGFLVENGDDSSHIRAHVLVYDPETLTVFEGWERRLDGYWICNSYGPVTKTQLEHVAERGPTWLNRSIRTGLPDAYADDLSGHLADAVRSYQRLKEHAQ